MKIQRISALTFATLLCLQLIVTPLAFAEEAAQPIENEDGSLQIIETYPVTEEAPELPATIVHEGNSYELEDTIVEPGEPTEPTVQVFTRTLFSEVPLEGINNLGAYFPATVSIDEGDYQGEIGLHPTNPYTIIERYEAWRNQVDKTATLTGLPDNDVTRIPTQQVFEVASAESPGATTQATLQLLDVQYEITGRDHLGLPNEYTAYLIYRGQEEYLELHHYDVTANYAGELTHSLDQLVTTAIYQPEPTPVAVAPVATITQPETPMAQPEEFPLVPLAVTSAVVVVVLAFPLLYLFMLTNARLIRVVEQEVKKKNGEHITKETTELICRRRLVLKQGVAEFKIPSSANIMDGSTYYLTVKPHLASKEGHIILAWQGKVVAAVPLARHLDINFRDMLVTSVEAILANSDVLD